MHLRNKWVELTLGEVGNWFGGGTPSKSNTNYWTCGSTPWISPKDMKAFRLVEAEDNLSELALSETNVKTFPRGSVLIVVRSGILERTLPIGVSEVKATINQDLKGFTPYDRINAYFLAYQLKFRERDILNRCCKDGTTVTSIEVPRLLAYPVLLPTLEEQTRIVAKIEELFSDLDAGVAALERVRSGLKRYRAAVLKAAVEGKLTEDWRAQHPDTEPASALLDRILAERRRKWEEAQIAKFAEAAKQPSKNWQTKYIEPVLTDGTNEVDLPSGWTFANIDQVSHFAKYGSSAKTAEGIEGVPVLRMGNIQDGQLDLGKLKYLPYEHDEFPSLCLESGDLLFNRTNSAELVGKTAVYQGHPSPCSFASYLIAVRLLAGCNAQLLSYYLNSVFGRQWINSVVTQQVGQANVNGTKLSSLVFPLPTEPEQAVIVEEVERRLSIIKELEGQVEANLKRASRLRQGILKRAFEGRLVQQDPNDEPADQLLARIRQQRAAEAKPKPTRPRKRATGSDATPLLPEDGTSPGGRE